ncbi:MAG TPA: MBL fold metallo-hydrolase [Verrucomicrobiae bacterium]|nr:MBL fold metallo-hydrolase [Verrucomicrobiae bacterium]
MIHEILPVGMLQCNCSVFGDESTREAMVVDPGDEVESILEIVRRHGLTVKAIVITHAHIDHIGGAKKMKEATGAPVYMNLNDTGLAKMLDMQAAMLGMRPVENVGIDVPAKDGDTLTVGATEVHVMHTPGHTQGSICLWMPSERKLIAGDTLFRDSIGRTDLPGGNGKQILQSIHDKLLPLAGATIVIPGHGDVTTIEREKRLNYFLQGMS